MKKNALYIIKISLLSTKDESTVIVIILKTNIKTKAST